MTSMMTQLSDAIGQQMNTVMTQFATNMSSAFSMDPNAFAEAFQSNVDEKSLAALMATMFSTNVPTLETNLRTLDGRTSPRLQHLDLPAFLRRQGQGEGRGAPHLKGAPVRGHPAGLRPEPAEDR